MSEDSADKTSPSSIRLDKWLFFARIIKSRTLAGKMIGAGHVRINGEKTTQPSRAVKPGDILTVSLERAIKVLHIVDCGTRRGPAPEAQLLYEDRSPPPLEKSSKFESLSAKRDAGAGRPTKKERRETDRLRNI